MKTHSDVKASIDASNIGLISLEKVVGKKIKEIQGHISREHDDPVFQLYRIIFEDDSSSFVEGAHDMAYLSSLGSGISQKELINIYKTNPNYDPSEEDDEDENY